VTRPAPAAYEVTGLRRVYGERTVLDVESLRVEPGEVLALVGPNGAGKSTLLRILNFLEPWTSGEVRYDGHRLSFPPPLTLRRQVTMVFQRPVLLRRSVRENVAYGQRLRGQASGETIERLLDRLHLRQLDGVPARSLSVGEMQRVALARALVLRPQVLLLDEPTANLDPSNVALIEHILAEVRAEGRTTVVLVSHNIHQARRLADRVGLLLSGRLVEVASAGEFFDHPVDPRTRAFVRGEMIY
jgi:tungstate transport system ATP-binding protein